MVTEDVKANLLGTPASELRERLAPWIDRGFRSDQVFRAIHHQRAADFQGMTELPGALRAELQERFSLDRPALERSVRSLDGTVKALFRLADGASIETVLIPEAQRRTLCLSSQAGCALGCKFCVTGYWGAGRDLDAHEIVGQVFDLRERENLANEMLNLVLMGMGEPLLNLGAVRPALEVLGEVVAWRRMTVSTAGVIPGIEDLMRWDHRPNLAVSLHAADDERRSQLMPINRKYPLRELLAVLKRFPATSHRPLTFEYTLIRGFNDSHRDMASLARLVRGFEAKVNLIPLNEDPVLGNLRAPDWAHAQTLQRELVGRGIRASVRRPRGEDVSAACGQLRAFARAPRGQSEPLSVV